MQSNQSSLHIDSETSTLSLNPLNFAVVFVDQFIVIYVIVDQTCLASMTVVRLALVTILHHLHLPVKAYCWFSLFSH